MPATENKVILVTRPTRLQDLVGRFNTVGQARFFVEHQGVDFDDYEKEDATYQAALAEVSRVVESAGRIQRLERRFLQSYVFGPKDVLVALGQDGLVANTLKYLDGQKVIGVNPDPHRWDGQLLPFRPADLSTVLLEVFGGGRPWKTVTMARAQLNDGQQLLGVNDLFVGMRGHTSARYSIQCGSRQERHSSSGVVISTGLGSTGWLKSLLNGATSVVRGLAHDRGLPDLTAPLTASAPPATSRGNGDAALVDSAFAWDAPHVFFTVREPFPSGTTGTALAFGRASNAEPLIVESLMPDGGVIFSDGIESDFLAFNSGARATIGLADKSGRLVV